MLFLHGSDKGTASNFVQSRQKCDDGDTVNDYTSVRGRRLEPYMESPKSPRPKMGRYVKSKVKSMLIISFDIKGMFKKNSFWQAKQSIPHTTVTFVCDCVKMGDDFVPNFGDKRTECCLTTTQPSHTFFSTIKCRTESNMTLVPHPPYSPDLAPCDFSLFPRLKIKMKGLHVDTIEVIEKE
jgi:hypothetical protein